MPRQAMCYYQGQRYTHTCKVTILTAVISVTVLLLTNLQRKKTLVDFSTFHTSLSVRTWCVGSALVACHTFIGPTWTLAHNSCSQYGYKFTK